MSDKMINKPFHITGLGSALIDIYAHVTEAELADLLTMKGAGGGHKGTMLLIEEAQSRQLLERLKPDSQAAGGATANSIFGMARMGLKTGFIGKIGNDKFGQLFADDMAAQNIIFPTNIKHTEPTGTAGPVTGHVIVLITPDAERTMYTLIGASATLAPQDLDKDLLTSSAYFFSEAYLFDSPSAKQAFITACDWVHAAGGQIVFSLADPLCVARHRAELTDIITHKIDILLANEAEARALFGGASFA
ncbi:MAG: adenosine kinase, partial [Alphaproteobacteria bacterium]|nr:adenosine kinase [Alphaproteobacteria bacterium]